MRPLRATIPVILGVASAATLVLGRGVQASLGSEARVGAATDHQAADRRAAIDEVLQLSGMGALFDQLPDLVRARAAEHQTEVPADVFVAVQQAIADAYGSSRLRDGFAQYVDSRFDQERMARVRDWLHSPLASSMTELETQASSPGATEALRQFLQQMETAGPPERRLTLIQRLNQAVRGTEFSLRLSGQEFAAVTEMIRAAQRPGELPDQPAIARATEAFQQRQRPAMEASVVAQFLFTYQAATDEQIEQYIAFWESDLGQWFNRLATDAFLSATAGAARQSAQRIAQIAVEPTDEQSGQPPAVLGATQ